MEEVFPDGQYLLKSTFRRHKETFVHILRPARGVRENGYEHILDLNPVSKGSSLEVSRFQTDNLDSPMEPQPYLRKEDDDLDLLLGLQEHRSRTLHPAPPLDYLSHNPSGERNELPSWSQTRFRLHRSSPLSPFSPFLSQLNGNVWPTPRHPPASNVEDPLRYNDQKRRRSCEYCRSRKKKCSGHSTCIRCFRQGINCVYLPDLIAKRMAECLSRPSLRSHFSAASISTAGGRSGKFYCSDSGKKRASSGSKKHQWRTRLAQAAPNLDRYTSLSDCPGLADAGLGSTSVEFTLHLAGGSFGVAGRDVDSRNTDPGSLSFCVPDYSAEPQEVTENVPETQPSGFAKDEAGATDLEHSPLDIDATAKKATLIFGIDIFPSTEAMSSLESFKSSSAPSTPFPSLVPQSPNSPVSIDTVIAGNPEGAWAVDDWLAWYDFTLSQ